DVVFDSHLTTAVSGKATRAIVAGSRKDILIPYLSEFHKKSIPVLGIYTPHDALYRLHPFTGLTSCIMLHISRLVSIIVIVVEGEWRFARVLPVGYDWLIAKLKSKWKNDAATIHRLLQALPTSLDDSSEVDTFKKAHKITNAKFAMLTDAVADFTHVMRRELAASLRNLQLDADDEKIAQEKLTGENIDAKPFSPESMTVALSSDLNNAVVLENALASNLKYQVEKFPYERTPLALLNREHLITMGGAYSQTTTSKLNLLKDDLKKWVVSSRAGASRLILALGVAAVLLFSLSFLIDLKRRGYELREWETRQAKVFQQFFPGVPLPDSESYLSTAMQLVKKEKQKTEILDNFFNSPRLSAVLVALHQNISTDAQLEITSFYFNDRGVEINGLVPDYARLEDMKRSLAKSTLLTAVESKNENSSPGPNGQNRIKFTLFCKVKKVEQ
ncbi:MAG TPA: hypothetical protein PLY93_08625, partial [Turneriella sp.]|nr:hypothetical protein [Turneriella sp.]